VGGLFEAAGFFVIDLGGLREGGQIAGFRHTVTNVWSEVDAVITELKVHYTRLDGIELTLPCCNVFRIRDGAVADYRVYMDIDPVYA
jgi:ketosteroid isomerase-like protein